MLYADRRGIPLNNPSPSPSLEKEGRRAARIREALTAANSRQSPILGLLNSAIVSDQLQVNLPALNLPLASAKIARLDSLP